LLARFHFEPRRDLATAMAREAARTGGTLRWIWLHGAYARYAVLPRP
jgi:hypothetical protein